MSTAQTDVLQGCRVDAPDPTARAADASRIAWTVSAHRGRRRAMPVLGRGKSIMAASRSTADSGRRPLDDVAQGDGSPLLRHHATEGGEVFGVEVGRQAPLAEVGDDDVTGRLVVLPGTVGQFAGFHQGALGVQEPVASFLDRDAVGRLAGLAAGVRRILLFQVLRQRAVGVGPDTGGMWEQREKEGRAWGACRGGRTC